MRFASDKEAARLMQPIEPLEIDVAPIHDVKGAGFRDQRIENIHIVQLPVADMNEARDIAAQIVSFRQASVNW